MKKSCRTLRNSAARLTRARWLRLTALPTQYVPSTAKPSAKLKRFGAIAMTPATSSAEDRASGTCSSSTSSVIAIA